MTRLVKVAMTTASMINWVSGSLLSFFLFFFFVLSSLRCRVRSSFYELLTLNLLCEGYFFFFIALRTMQCHNSQ